MSQLLEACDKNDNVTSIEMEWDCFFDWDTHLAEVYKKLKAMLKYQYLTCSRDTGHGVMIICKTSDIEDCTTVKDDLNI